LEADPEGAITLARALLETVCKYILDERGVRYDNDIDLPACTSWWQSRCAAVVEGLGALRNCLSDAHGQGKSR
jgi:hypothetical protein